MSVLHFFCYICRFFNLFFAIRTFKNNCPVHISLRANESGSALEIKSTCLIHNHETSQVGNELSCKAHMIILYRSCSSTYFNKENCQGKGGKLAIHECQRKACPTVNFSRNREGSTSQGFI